MTQELDMQLILLKSSLGLTLNLMVSIDLNCSGFSDPPINGFLT